MEIDVSVFEKALPIPVLYFDSIDSTSLYCKRKIKEGIPFDGVVIAAHQTDGQGRCGKKFYSPKDTGLYLTFSLRASAFDLHDFTPAVALAVCNAIEQNFSINCGVKWVNDIYINNRKAAGVLCQLIDDYFLIGIGINLIKPAFIPHDLEQRMGWVTDNASKDTMAKLVSSLYDMILYYGNKDVGALLEEYRARCVHFGKAVEIDFNNEDLKGVCVGIDDDFSLVVEINGKNQRFTSGYMTLKI